MIDGRLSISRRTFPGGKTSGRQGTAYENLEIFTKFNYLYIIFQAVVKKNGIFATPQFS